MLRGEYSDRPGGGGVAVPHVVVLSVTRAAARGNDFIVTIHEEGTAFNWCQRISLKPETERFLLAAVSDLHRWTLGEGALTKRRAQTLATRLGKTLYASFVGKAGTEVLTRVKPTAIMLAVDETLLAMPWELMPGPHGEWLYDVPVGRIVTTGWLPVPGRDPKAENPLVRILVVANPTGDLEAADTEVGPLKALAGSHGDVRVEVTVLNRRDATRAGFRAAVRNEDYDIIHLAGHAAFSHASPGESALMLSDGTLTADEVIGLRWAAPPYIVFNSACESARAARGRRLVSAGHRNGLAAAFLAAGAEAYIGHFFPVDDWGAARFSTTFYESLFRRVNVGTAVLEARQAVRRDFLDDGHLTSGGSVFFGDAGTAERRELARAR